MPLCDGTQPNEPRSDAPSGMVRAPFKRYRPGGAYTVPPDLYTASRARWNAAVSSLIASPAAPKLLTFSTSGACVSSFSALFAILCESSNDVIPATVPKDRSFAARCRLHVFVLILRGLVSAHRNLRALPKFELEPHSVGSH